MLLLIHSVSIKDYNLQSSVWSLVDLSLCRQFSDIFNRQKTKMGFWLRENNPITEGHRVVGVSLVKVNQVFRKQFCVDSRDLSVLIVHTTFVPLSLPTYIADLHLSRFFAKVTHKEMLKQLQYILF